MDKADQFRQAFAKIQRRWNVSEQLMLDYLEVLGHVPVDRYEEISNRIFHDYDRLPAPRIFTELSVEIGAREAAERSASLYLESAENREVRALTPEQCAENRAHLAELVRSAAAKAKVDVAPRIKAVLPKESPEEELARLNRRIQDPILRADAIAAIQSRPDLAPVFSDSDGSIVGVARAA